MRLRLLLLLPILWLLGSCGSDKIIFLYPDEQLDFRAVGFKTPALYIDTVTDLRPPEQRNGRGHFFGVDFPKDESWDRPVTQIYAEALAQDVEQTHLVELVPLLGQADFVLSMDLLSLGCRFERSPASLLLAASIGVAAGMAFGDDASQQAKLGVSLAVVSMLAVPMPSHNYAEAEVRLTLKNRDGDILWQKSCLGQYDEKMWVGVTARQDQKLVDEHLTVAVKRANACLLGQLRQTLIELGGNQE